MKKSFLFSILILSFIFTGCTSYSITKYFDKDEFYNKAIQYTKKADIKEKETLKVMLNVTYLNSVSSDFDNEKQNFVIGLYFVNKDQQPSLQNDEYLLLLNDKEPISIQKLKIDDKLTSNIPLKNNWAQYYFVSFDKEKVQFFEKEVQTLTLSYENIEEKKMYLTQKELEEKALEKRSLFDATAVSTLTQTQRAVVTFLKEL